MNSWITAHNNLLLALILELHLMLHLRDISSIKCNISDSFSTGRTRSPLYSRIVVLFERDRTQLSSSVFAEQSIRIDLPGYPIPTNDSFFSNFITSNHPLVLTLPSLFGRVRTKRASNKSHDCDS
jgi:hypothetical protein